MNFIRYILDSTQRTAVGLVCLLALAFGGLSIVSAATSYNVHNVPDMFLNVGITGTATSGITIAAPTRNGDAVTYPTLTGGIFKFQQGSREELVYYATATVNSTTKVITLAGVIRGVCWNQNTSITQCETGKIFSKGASVRLVDAAQLLNLKMNIDRTNTTVGSGSILCGSTVNPCMFQGRYTTAERDAFTWKGGAGVGTPIIHNTTSGTLQWWDGGAWVEIGDTGTANATEAIAGKVELGTLADQSGATLLGATTASTVVQTQYLTGTGGRAWRIPFTGRSGTLTGSLLCSGNQYANGGRQYCSGSGSWAAMPTTGNMFYFYASSTGSNLVSGTTNETLLNKQPTLTGALAGDSYLIRMRGITSNGGSNNPVRLRVKINGVNLLVFPRLAPQDGLTHTWTSEVQLRIMSGGASAKILADGKQFCLGACTFTGQGGVGSGAYLRQSLSTINMTTDPKITVSLQMSDATAGNNALLEDITIYKGTAPLYSQ